MPAKLFVLLFFLFFLPMQAIGAEKSVTELKVITQAGGSLIIDMDRHAYSVPELVALASSLKYQATLTVRVGNSSLSAPQCAQIAKARPGQVIFWF